MNILFLCDEYPPGRHGGIGTSVQLLARTLVGQGHRVVVAGFYPWGYGESDQFDDHGVLVHRFRRGFDTRSLSREEDSLRTRGLLWWMKRTGLLEWDIRRSLDGYASLLIELIQKHRIDVVEQADYQDYMRFCLKHVGFPVLPVLTVMKLHSSMTYLSLETGRAVRPVVREMEAELLRRADAVAAVSQYTARKTAAYLGYPHPIHVLYNGIKVDRSHPPDKIGLTVVFAGSLRIQKGIRQLLSAWNAVHRAIPSAELHIFGKGRADKIARVLNPEARETVHFRGHVDRLTLLEQFGKASLAVFPSFAESFSLTPMEAMSQGTAVIYTARASGPELIVHDETGCLVDPDDTDDLTRQILRLLRDGDLRERLGQAGRHHVAARFNIERIAGDHVEWYTGVQQRWSGVMRPTAP